MLFVYDGWLTRNYRYLLHVFLRIRALIIIRLTSSSLNFSCRRNANPASSRWRHEIIQLTLLRLRFAINALQTFQAYCILFIWCTAQLYSRHNTEIGMIAARLSHLVLFFARAIVSLVKKKEKKNTAEFYTRCCDHTFTVLHRYHALFSVLYGFKVLLRTMQLRYRGPCMHAVAITGIVITPRLSCHCAGIRKNSHVCIDCYRRYDHVQAHGL